MEKEIKKTDTQKKIIQEQPVSQGKETSKDNMGKVAEAWASELRTPSWQLAALKQHMKLTEGKSLTQEEFINGISTAINKHHGGF